MSNFTDVWSTLDWDDISLRINSKTSSDVERALSRNKIDRDGFMALISPAALPYLEEMAQRAQQLTRQRFGNTVNFFAPFISPTFAPTSARTAASR